MSLDECYNCFGLHLSRDQQVTNFRLHLITFILSVLTYAPIMWVAAAQDRPDYREHARENLKLVSGESSPVSHLLYFGASVFYANVIPRADISLPTVSFAAVMTFIVPLPLVILAFLKRMSRNQISDRLLVALSLGLALAAPTMIWPSEFMIGYLNSIVYHNPTLIALRLFAIPVSWFAVVAFAERGRQTMAERYRMLLLCVALILTSIMAKPSYIVALIPGCFAFAVWQLKQRRPVDWVLLIGGIMLPGLFLLNLQYNSVYVEHSNASKVAFGFLKFFEHHVPMAILPIRILFSLVFPLGVLLLYFNKARHDVNLMLSWVVFVVGALIALFVYETGPRESHGNFVWTGYIVTFVLMYASLSFVIEQAVAELRAGSRRGVFGLPESDKVRIALFLFGLHVISGFIYYAHFMRFPPE